MTESNAPAARVEPFAQKAEDGTWRAVWTDAAGRRRYNRGMSSKKVATEYAIAADARVVETMAAAAKPARKPRPKKAADAKA